jgi:hypothetical protein
VKTTSFLALLLFLPVLAAPLLAKDNIITNGDFETEPREDESYPFYQTPGWYNRADKGKHQDFTARTNKENGDDSVYTASINNTYPPNSVFLQRTKHQIKAGEILQLSLDFRYSFNWHAWDHLRVTIFSTMDDSLGGAVVWEDSVDLENPSGQSWSNVTHTFKPAPPDAEGKRIYFSFQGLSDRETVNKGEGGFARVDNIVLTVAP